MRFSSHTLNFIGVAIIFASGVAIYSLKNQMSGADKASAHVIILKSQGRVFKKIVGSPFWTGVAEDDLLGGDDLLLTEDNSQAVLRIIATKETLQTKPQTVVRVGDISKSGLAGLSSLPSLAHQFFEPAPSVVKTVVVEAKREENVQSLFPKPGEQIEQLGSEPLQFVWMAPLVPPFRLELWSKEDSNFKFVRTGIDSFYYQVPASALPENISQFFWKVTHEHSAKSSSARGFLRKHIDGPSISMVHLVPSPKPLVVVELEKGPFQRYFLKGELQGRKFELESETPTFSLPLHKLKPGEAHIHLTAEPVALTVGQKPARGSLFEQQWSAFSPTLRLLSSGSKPHSSRMTSDGKLVCANPLKFEIKTDLFYPLKYILIESSQDGFSKEHSVQESNIEICPRTLGATKLRVQAHYDGNRVVESEQETVSSNPSELNLASLYQESQKVLTLLRPPLNFDSEVEIETASGIRLEKLKVGENQVRTGSHPQKVRMRWVSSEGQAVSPWTSWNEVASTCSSRKLASQNVDWEPTNPDKIKVAKGSPSFWIHLEWQPLEGVKTYIIEISEDETFERVKRLETIKSKYLLVHPNKSGTYYWRVMGVSEEESWPWSMPASFRVLHSESS